MATFNRVKICAHRNLVAATILGSAAIGISSDMIPRIALMPALSTLGNQSVSDQLSNALFAVARCCNDSACTADSRPFATDSENHSAGLCGSVAFAETRKTAPVVPRPPTQIRRLPSAHTQISVGAKPVVPLGCMNTSAGTLFGMRLLSSRLLEG